MENKNCIIIGAGTYGQVYAEYLKDHYNIIGFYDDNISLKNTSINGVMVLGKVEDAYLLDTSTAVFIPIGNNPVRVKLLKSFKERGFPIPSFIHDKTIIHSSVKIGEAVYILPGTTVMPLSSISDFCMISVNSTISHHTILKPGVFVSFGANVGASITLEDLAYLGIGSTIMTGVNTVGASSLIGAGAVVIKDVPKGATMVGNPARVLPSKL